ncbi:MAG TPA: nucleotide sugar dehydrogenase [Candidatus Dormibacteraeota bacterium]|nr:nucleotide sugar dehydrogenase [Candidatus Dormibacteraeota bacterium]
MSDILEPLVSSESTSLALDELSRRLAERVATIGVIGIGYVGLPLAVEFARCFPKVIGFDVDSARVGTVNAGRSHVGDVSGDAVADLVAGGSLVASSDFTQLALCDAILICVPTPLGVGNLPDLSCIYGAAEQVTGALRPGQLIILESTTYPGTTEELLVPILERSSLEFDRDFLVAFSPERIDPGRDLPLREIPKIIGGCNSRSSDAAALLYGTIFAQTHIVSSARAAETVKLLENTFRLVNIGFINEFARLCRQLNLDSGEVIAAASTKPFGFMPFEPGPGVGGHCIPLDPHYLAWESKRQGFTSRFIELAEDVNAQMPAYVVDLIADALNESGKAFRDARILVIGVAYKRNVADTRRSPAISVIDRLRMRGAAISYHDPYVPNLDTSHNDWPEWRPRVVVPYERRQGERSGDAMSRRRVDSLQSIPLTREAVAHADCVVILTDHAGVDYAMLLDAASILVDTRHAVTTAQALNAHAKVYLL